MFFLFCYETLVAHILYLQELKYRFFKATYVIKKILFAGNTRSNNNTNSSTNYMRLNI